VPQIGLLTVRPARGVAIDSLQATLQRLPGVASVQPERRYVPRSLPNDPTLTPPGPSPGVPWQWYLEREGFDRAWSLSHGTRALVGVLDTGIDASHPDLAPKIAAAVDQQSPIDSSGPGGTDQVGHGTHVASLACADTDNGIGLAGAGYDCRLVVEKTDFTDSSIAAAIIDATRRHVVALNMSFGPSSGGSGSAPRSEVRALDYALAHRVILVAAAADSPGTEQGDPANVLQPTSSGPSLDKGIGLDVTAADYSGKRANFAGSGTEISLAAYGAFRSSGNVLQPCGQPAFGLFGAFPANSSQMESFPPTACRVNYRGDNRYATIAGTSMAAPQVAATAAMMRVLNPYAWVRDILRTIKRTAQRPRGRGWTSDLGWGILDAGAALEAIRRVDRLAPVSRLITPRVTRKRSWVLRWTGHDARRRELVASGIAYYELYERVGTALPIRLARTRGHRFTFHGLSGRRYTFWVVAVDRAGNRQRHPVHLSTRVL
jgi:subtilisin family serine protease